MPSPPADRGVALEATAESPDPDRNGARETPGVVMGESPEYYGGSASIDLRRAMSATGVGFCVYDAALQLVSWNQAFEDFEIIPREMIRHGLRLQEAFRATASRGVFGPGDPEHLAKAHIEKLEKGQLPPFEEIRTWKGRILEVRRFGLPGGGLFATFCDVTERHKTDFQLKLASRLLVEGAEHAAGVDFFRSCVRAIGDTLRVKYVALSRIRTGDEQGTVLAMWMEGEQLEESMTFRAEGSPCGAVVENSCVSLYSNAGTAFPDSKTVEELGVTGYLGVPLICPASRTPIGVLAIMDDEPFDESLSEHVQLILQVFAARAASELERIEAEDALHRQIERARVLEELTNQVRSSLDLDSVLAKATEETNRLFEASRCVILKCDSQNATALRVVAEAAQSGVRSIVGEEIDISENRLFQQIMSGDDVQLIDGNDPAGEDWLVKLGVRSQMAVRTSYRGVANGVLALHNVGRHRQPSGAEIGLFSRVAAKIGIALAHAEMLQEEKDNREQLRKVNDELIRSARMKDEFLAGMSHELRTPLNSVLGFCEGLMDSVYGELTGRQRRALGNISDSGQHLLNLINDILDLAKVGAGEVELSRQWCLVSDLCRLSLKMIRPSADKKDLDVSWNCAEEVPERVFADQRRFLQILVNLLSNAVKFTEPGGSVSIEIRPGERKGDVIFDVVDNGSGIDPEMHGRLFMPFVQLDGGLSRCHEGAGLGLALVKHLADLHGGGVELESEPGVGSRFSITLPGPKVRPRQESVSAPKSAAGPEHEDTATREGGARRPADGGDASATGADDTFPAGLRVLLVDDNRSNVESVFAYLDRRGFDVHVARNGYQAIEAAASCHPDVILMDIQMPGIDGLETTRRLRERDDTCDIPIIAVTALAMQGDRERVLSHGIDEYLSKPISMKELVKVIRRCASISSGSDSAPAAAAAAV